MIHVIASITARDSMREIVEKAFREILSTVRAKPGCIQYELAVNFPSGFPGQPPYDDNELLIVEEWTDLDHLRAHMEDPKYRAWYVEIWPFVSKASMRVFASP
jgi:quinol monooxygenase YgiN